MSNTRDNAGDNAVPFLKIRVPATSANLGSGFDCVGVALNLWNTFELHLAPGQTAPVVVESRGEGAATLPRDHTNAIARILFEELEENLGQSAPAPLRIVARNTVPCGSGLGSSSTAVIAGLVFAHALARRDTLTQDAAATLKRAVLTRAVETEGHGDNVAPALLGGLVVVTRTPNGRLLAHPLPLAPQRVVVCVPDFAFLTSKARAVLPPALPRADAIHNIGHAILTAEALRAGDLRLLADALDDRMHEPYRLPAIPGALEAKQAAEDAGAACCLSGAGPGILAFAAANHEHIGVEMQRRFAEAGLKARYWLLETNATGAEITLATAA